MASHSPPPLPDLREEEGATRSWFHRVVRKAAKRLGYELVPERYLHAYDRGSLPAPNPEPTPEALRYLDTHHPRLVELRRRYAATRVDASAHSLWSPGYIETQIRLRAFRAQSAYVWSFRELPRATQLKYFLYSQCVQEKAGALLGRLSEDGAYGCLCYDFETVGRVSRDRMDSAVELDFLDRHMGLLSKPDLRVLDIGAGYGRLAHRTCELAPQLADYVCLDAVAESTFLCEHYIGFRGLTDRVRVVPLDEIPASNATLGRFDIAINVHSFTECTLAAIRWWIDLIRRHDIPYLFVIPNAWGTCGTDFLSTEPDYSRQNFLPVLEKAGYQIRVQEPLFESPDVRRLLGIYDHLYLFERR